MANILQFSGLLDIDPYWELRGAATRVKTATASPGGDYFYGITTGTTSDDLRQNITGLTTDTIYQTSFFVYRPDAGAADILRVGAWVFWGATSSQSYIRFRHSTASIIQVSPGSLTITQSDVSPAVDVNGVPGYRVWFTYQAPSEITRIITRSHRAESGTGYYADAQTTPWTALGGMAPYERTAPAPGLNPQYYPAFTDPINITRPTWYTSVWDKRLEDQTTPTEYTASTISEILTALQTIGTTGNPALDYRVRVTSNDLRGQGNLSLTASCYIDFATGGGSCVVYYDQLTTTDFCRVDSSFIGINGTVDGIVWQGFSFEKELPIYKDRNLSLGPSSSVWFSTGKWVLRYCEFGGARYKTPDPLLAPSGIYKSGAGSLIVDSCSIRGATTAVSVDGTADVIIRDSYIDKNFADSMYCQTDDAETCRWWAEDTVIGECYDGGINYLVTDQPFVLGEIVEQNNGSIVSRGTVIYIADSSDPEVDSATWRSGWTGNLVWLELDSQYGAIAEGIACVGQTSSASFTPTNTDCVSVGGPQDAGPILRALHSDILQNSKPSGEIGSSYFIATHRVTAVSAPLQKGVQQGIFSNSNANNTGRQHFHNLTYLFITGANGILLPTRDSVVNRCMALPGPIGTSLPADIRDKYIDDHADVGFTLVDTPLGTGYDQKVTNVIVSTDTISNLTAFAIPFADGLVVATPFVADTDPTSYTSVFGMDSGKSLGDQYVFEPPHVPNFASLEQARNIVNGWVLDNFEPESLGGWDLNNTGNGYISPMTDVYTQPVIKILTGPYLATYSGSLDLWTYEARSAAGADITANVVVDTSGVDTETEGTYFVKLDVSDGGTSANTRYLPVVVGAAVPPVNPPVGGISKGISRSLMRSIARSIYAS